MGASGLELLIALSHRIGKTVPAWNQARGGNLSWKDGKTLWIKASGTSLGQVSRGSGLARVDLPAFRTRVAGCTTETEYSLILADPALTSAGQGRPSMESAMHLALESPYVCHFHSIAGMLLAFEHGRDPARVNRWIGTRSLWSTVAFLPPTMPGFALAERAARGSGNEILILGNHGVVLGVRGADQIEQWMAFELAFCAEWNYPRVAEALTLGEGAMNSHFFRVGPPSPMRIFFPDAALYAGGSTRPASESAEIWAATALLQKSCPDFPELPGAIVDEILGSSTEIYRMGKA